MGLLRSPETLLTAGLASPPVLLTPGSWCMSVHDGFHTLEAAYNYCACVASLRSWIMDPRVYLTCVRADGRNSSLWRLPCVMDVELLQMTQWSPTGRTVKSEKCPNSYHPSRSNFTRRIQVQDASGSRVHLVRCVRQGHERSPGVGGVKLGGVALRQA